MNYAEMQPREPQKQMPGQTLGEANLEQRVLPKPPNPEADLTQLPQEWMPYSSSYYIPGELEGIELIF